MRPYSVRGAFFDSLSHRRNFASFTRAELKKRAAVQ